MNIQSAILKGANILKDKSILSAQLDTEILLARIYNEHKNNKNKILFIVQIY